MKLLSCFFNFFASFILSVSFPRVKREGGGHRAPCCPFQDTSNHASNDTSARDGVAQFCCRLSRSDNHFFVHTDFFMIGEGVSHTLVDSFFETCSFSQAGLQISVFASESTKQLISRGSVACPAFSMVSSCARPKEMLPEMKPHEKVI